MNDDFVKAIQEKGVDTAIHANVDTFYHLVHDVCSVSLTGLVSNRVDSLSVEIVALVRVMVGGYCLPFGH